jgi:predicted ATPase
VYLEAFGVKNLRCLTDTGLVPIKPITLLVGKNSSGKSTFLRAFPLLRQSVETARNSPVLWYDERYVDFGSLQAAANNRLSEPSVTFQFRLRLPEGAQIVLGNPAFDIAMTLAGDETPYVNSYKIRVEDNELLWTFDTKNQLKNIAVNGKKIELDGQFSLGGKAHLLPTLQPNSNENFSFQSAPDIFQLSPIMYQTALYAGALLVRPVADELRNIFHHNDVTSRIASQASLLQIGKRSAMRKQLLSIHEKLKQEVGDLNFEENQFNLLASRVAIRLSPFILEAADLVLTQFMSRISYLPPQRASAQRAYRIQNLAVDEVDSHGKNLAMFLRSLSSTETESFADFTRSALGFETKVKTTGIYAEILIKEGSAKQFVNLIDVGFGYSEVLPLTATLWANCIRPAITKRESASLIAMEQPELHLHPAHQAKLARMLVEAVSASRAAGAPAQLIVETHSESLINGLGKLVYEGLIKKEDIQILLFDQDEETGETDVRFAGYRENGALHDWPYGFLSPVAERRVPPAAE